MAAPVLGDAQVRALAAPVLRVEQVAHLLVVDLEAARLDRVVVRHVAGGLDVERRREARQEARVLEALGRGPAVEQAVGLAAARLAVGEDAPVVPGQHRVDDGQPDLLEDLGLLALAAEDAVELKGLALGRRLERVAERRAAGPAQRLVDGALDVVHRDVRVAVEPDGFAVALGARAAQGPHAREDVDAVAAHRVFGRSPAQPLEASPVNR